MESIVRSSIISLLLSKKLITEEEEEDEGKILCHQLSALSTSSVVVLPPEVTIYEILTRVPLHNLLSQFQLVCKDWWSAINESNFRFIHSRRASPISGYFIQADNNAHFVSYTPITYPSLNSSLLKDITIASSSSSPDGLLCCVGSGTFPNNQVGPRFYVYKPATRECLQIPNPKTSSYHTIDIGIVVIKYNPLHYKLIRICELSGNSQVIRCMIFDSNIWRWKICKGLQLPLDILEHRKRIFIHGAFHWLTKDGQICLLNIKDDKTSSKAIATLPSKDEFGGEDDPACLETQLVEYEAEVGVLYLPPHRSWVELWVLDNYYSKSKKRRWTKKFRNDLRPLFHGRNLASKMRIFTLYTNNIILMKYNGKIIWYNCITGTKTLALLVPRCKYLRAHPIHSDLVPCNIVN